MKMYVLTKTCTWLFRTLLFVIAQKWKQPKCLQYHRILFSNKRKWTVDTTACRDLKGILWVKKPISKDIKHSGNDKDRDGEQINGWQGVEVVRRKEAGVTTVEPPPEIFVLMESCLDGRWLHKSTHVIKWWRTHYTTVSFLPLVLYYSYVRANPFQALRESKWSVHGIALYYLSSFLWLYFNIKSRKQN